MSGQTAHLLHNHALGIPIDDAAETVFRGIAMVGLGDRDGEARLLRPVRGVFDEFHRAVVRDVLDDEFDGGGELGTHQRARVTMLAQHLFDLTSRLVGDAGPAVDHLGDGRGGDTGDLRQITDLELMRGIVVGHHRSSLPLPLFTIMAHNAAFFRSFPYFACSGRKIFVIGFVNF